jgi:hypothetical protein
MERTKNLNLFEFLRDFQIEFNNNNCMDYNQVNGGGSRFRWCGCLRFDII